MPGQYRRRHFASLVGLGVLAGLAATGCTAHSGSASLPAPVPRELNKVTHPAYVIEPPDILQIDLIAAVPRAPYRIRPLDVLGVSVPNALPESPVTGAFTVEPTGSIYLGAPYGSVAVAGLTLEEARPAAEKHLGQFLRAPVVNLSLVQTRAVQQVRGPHLVRQDGTIGLGTYGSVPVVGLTIAGAKAAVEGQLREYFQDPEVSVDIVGYNSKIYYVVFDFGGAGQQVVRVPITGNETVLDGVGQLNGLPTVADPRRIWLSRPGPDGCKPQVLPVNWKAIIEEGDTQTNYQILPGDRVFVKAYPLVGLDVKLARMISPIERVLGITLLGSSTVNSIRTDPNRNSGNSSVP